MQYIQVKPFFSYKLNGTANPAHRAALFLPFWLCPHLNTIYYISSNSLHKVDIKTSQICDLWAFLDLDTVYLPCNGNIEI